MSVPPYKTLRKNGEQAESGPHYREGMQPDSDARRVTAGVWSKITDPPQAVGETLQVRLWSETTGVVRGAVTHIDSGAIAYFQGTEDLLRLYEIISAALSASS